MKNLFFTAIAMMAFSFAGNATNLVNSVNSKKVIMTEKAVYTTSSKSLKADDCTWTVIRTKTQRVILADGTMQVTTIQIWACI